MTKIFPFDTKWETSPYIEMLEFAKNGLKNCTNILDLGCGRGESVFYFENHNIKTTGMEIRKFNAWKYFPNNKFIIYDGEKIDSPDNFFDGIFLNNVIEHVKNKKEFFKEIERVCKPNSPIVILVPTFWWKLRNFIFLPKHFIAFLRGYGIGKNYWFVHAPEVYGNNFLKENFDFLNWEKIVNKFIKIKNKKYLRKKQNLGFIGNLVN